MADLVITLDAGGQYINFVFNNMAAKAECKEMSIRRDSGIRAIQMNPAGTMIALHLEGVDIADTIFLSHQDHCKAISTDSVDGNAVATDQALYDELEKLLKA